MILKKKPTARKKSPAKKKAGGGTSVPVETRSAAVDPFTELNRWMDDAFNRRWMSVFRDRWPHFEGLLPSFEGHHPRVDVIEKNGEVCVKAELPGVKKEDLEVSLTDNTVSIKATTHTEEEEKEGDYHRREISRGEYRRTLALPSEVLGEKAKANFEDGVLNLVLPKAAQSKRRTIKVE